MLLLTFAVAIGIGLTPKFVALDERIVLILVVATVARFLTHVIVSLRSQVLYRAVGWTVTFLSTAVCLTILQAFERPDRWIQDIQDGFSIVILLGGVSLASLVEVVACGLSFGLSAMAKPKAIQRQDAEQETVSEQKIASGTENAD